MTKEGITERLSTLGKEQKSKKRELMIYSNIRLLLAIALIFGLVQYFRDKTSVGLIIAVLSFLLFCYYVGRFNHLKQHLTFLEAKKHILERYQRRLEDDWSFADEGEDAFNALYGSQENLDIVAYVKDLDLMGKRSLYQYLSVAHTISGQKYLLKTLVEPDFSTLEERQEAVLELLKDDDFAIDFETLGFQVKTFKREEEAEAERCLIEYAKDKTPLSPIFMALGFLMPVLTLSVISLAFLGIVPGYSVLLCVLGQIGASLLMGEEISKQRDFIMAFDERFYGYEKRFERLKSKTFESPQLRRMQAELANVEQGVNTLRRIASLWQWRENFIVYWFVCGILAWDFNMMFFLSLWRKEYGDSFEKWVAWLGKMEMLLSLGTIGRIHPEHSTMPKILPHQSPYVRMREGRHPLLPPSSVVANDFEQGGEMSIITGSNMSGKSTFMRTLGLNAVLAYAGGIVSAKEFEVTVMKIFTSMRVEDNIALGISTFYGEILRIKNAVEYSKQEKPMMVLVDEIFKGTNSADRIIGAEAAIKKLAQPWILGVVTTHDFELCELVNAQAIIGRNYHFEEFYEGDDIFFDYKIKPDRCHTTNAQHLMRMAGLLD